MNIFSSDEMKTLLAACSSSLEINLSLSRCFSFESFEITCLNYFIYGVNLRSSTTTRRMKILRFHHLLPVFLRFSADFAPSSSSLLKLWTWCGLSAFYLEYVYKWFYLILNPILSILNCFPTHVEPFHNFLIGVASSFESENLVPPRLLDHNLPNT